MLSDAPPLRVGQEELVDSVVVDVTIYNPGGPHLGAFPGHLFGAFRQRVINCLKMLVFYSKKLLKQASGSCSMTFTAYDAIFRHG